MNRLSFSANPLQKQCSNFIDIEWMQISQNGTFLSTGKLICKLHNSVLLIQMKVSFVKLHHHRRINIDRYMYMNFKEVLDPLGWNYKRLKTGPFI